MTTNKDMISIILKPHIYDHITQNPNPQVHREMSPYWVNKLYKADLSTLTNYLRENNNRIYQHYKYARLRRGRTGEETIYEIIRIDVAPGNFYCGCNTINNVFRIHLGKIKTETK